MQPSLLLKSKSATSQLTQKLSHTSLRILSSVTYPNSGQSAYALAAVAGGILSKKTKSLWQSNPFVLDAFDVCYNGQPQLYMPHHLSYAIANI